MAKTSHAYAQAAFNHAKKTEKLKKWVDFFEQIAPLSHQALRNPTLEKSALMTVFTDSLDLLPEQTAWLELLVSNRHLFLLPKISDSFFKAYRAEKGILWVEVTTANALNKTQQSSIKQKLKKQMNKDIEANFQVDETIIGGIQFEFEGKLIDHSLAHILKQMYLNR